jgi:NADH-quinone oxidoreductase subunit M
LNEQSLQGVIFQLLNFSLIASGLMLMAGFMQQRFGTTELIHLGGLAKVMPKMTAFFFLFSLASIGMPLTSGFPAEMLLIIGVLKNHLGLGIAALCGAILGTAALLTFIRGTFLGAIIHDNLKQTSDLRPREWLVLGVPILLVIIFGLFPQIILNVTEHSVNFWLSRFIF